MDLEVGEVHDLALTQLKKRPYVESTRLHRMFEQSLLIYGPFSGLGNTASYLRAGYVNF